MKQTILGCTPIEMRRKIQKRLRCCILAAIVAAVLNMLFTRLHTRQTAAWFLFANVLTETLCGWLILCRLTTGILPQKKWLRLFEEAGTPVSGTVETVASVTERYAGMDCYAACISGHRVYLVANGNLTLTPAEQIEAVAVDGILREITR